MTNKEIVFIAAAVLIAFFYFSYGYLYNDAEKQANDIKLCKSVGADWRYSDSDQVFCVKPKKECY